MSATSVSKPTLSTLALNCPFYSLIKLEHIQLSKHLLNCKIKWKKHFEKRKKEKAFQISAVSIFEFGTFCVYLFPFMQKKCRSFCIVSENCLRSLKKFGADKKFS